jgi:oxidase EvaA
MKNEILKVIEREYKINTDIKNRVEHLIECLSDKNQFYTLEEILEWFDKKVEEYEAEEKIIDLKDVDENWYYEKDTGNLVHTSGGFFRVIGVKINTNLREVRGGWSQPMVEQGTEASIAGIIKKRFNGIPHYLVSAKYEPGNYGKLQFSPTLQVTFSNLGAFHKGKKPLFAEYFEGDNVNGDIIFQNWWPEDGGRFFKKRVKNMIIEVSEDEEIDVPDYFKWLTMYQIKQLLKLDDLCNAHLRSVVSYL